MRIVGAVIVTLMLMSVPAPGRSSGAWGPDADETPSAADLFRAKRRADEVRRRLEIPRAEPRGWKQGGAGWRKLREREEPPSAPEAEASP